LSFSANAAVLVLLALAGIVVLFVWLRANDRAAQSGRSMLRSIPEGIARAKQRRRHVLVFFLEPEGDLTRALLELAFAPDLAGTLDSFERVRVDAARDDLDVVSHLAQKYGLAAIEPPTLLVLDRDGRKLDFLGLGAKEDGLRERFVQFLERARTRF
jgi:hypothetical protein